MEAAAATCSTCSPSQRGELLDHWFEGEPLKAALGWDSVVGNFASPYTPGSAYVLLHHLFGEVNGKTGVWGHAIGGMGAITQAMRKPNARRAASPSTPMPTCRGRDRRSTAAPLAWCWPMAARSARAAWSATSIRSCCTGSWSSASNWTTTPRERIARYRCGSAPSA
jgi:hypothetical protein